MKVWWWIILQEGYKWYNICGKLFLFLFQSIIMLNQPVCQFMFNHPIFLFSLINISFSSLTIERHTFFHKSITYAKNIKRFYQNQPDFRTSRYSNDFSFKRFINILCRGQKEADIMPSSTHTVYRVTTQLLLFQEIK